MAAAAETPDAPVGAAAAAPCPLSRSVQVATVLGGLAVIGLAAAVYVTRLELDVILAWLGEVFGLGFAVCYVALVCAALAAFSNLAHSPRPRFWCEVGLQSASGVATLALTFTLLGISLGIGTLSGQTLTPDTVQDVIKALTQHFSTAFMTTVVGLPTASALRAAIALRVAALPNTETAS